MAKVTVVERHENRATLNVQWIGHVLLSKIVFDDDPPWKKERPWHIVSFGVNKASVEDCIAYLEKIKEGSDDDAGSGHHSSECEGAYLMTE